MRKDQRKMANDILKNEKKPTTQGARENGSREGQEQQNAFEWKRVWFKEQKEPRREQ